MKIHALTVAAAVTIGSALAAAPLISAHAESKAATSADAKKSEAGQYVSDSAVTAKVKSALLAEKGLKATDITVETSNGTVQLAGFVGSDAQVAQAETVAKGVKGVKDVKNDLRLKAATQ